MKFQKTCRGRKQAASDSGKIIAGLRGCGG